METQRVTLWLLWQILKTTVRKTDSVHQHIHHDPIQQETFGVDQLI